MSPSKSRRSRKIIAALATPVAVIAAGALVYQASYAAFTGQTRNSGNEWSTGSVNLVDDDNGQARFQVTNMLPGSSGSACVRVTANASVPSTVKGYTINPVTSAQGIENHVKVTIEGGQGGTFSDCSGFVRDATGGQLATDVPLANLFAVNSFDNPAALGGWSVATGTASRTYKFSWKFDTGSLTQQQIDQLQGGKTGVDMQWEMRSDG